MSKKIKQQIYTVINNQFKNFNLLTLNELNANIDSGIKTIVKQNHFNKKIAQEYKNNILKKFSPRKKEDLKNILKRKIDLSSLSEELQDIFIEKYDTKVFSQAFNLEKELSIFEENLKMEKRNIFSQSLINDIINHFYQYAPARKLKRKFIYHSGPTNSGKTYSAIQKLKKSQSGCYLAPLRLLAWEKYEELSDNQITALITGEESVKPEGFTHSSSTIEMCNYNKIYDVAIIDEIQMIADDKRGWAWTKALLNVQAKEVHLCGDHSAIELIKKIISLTGDELVINEYERKTKLTLIKEPLSESDVQKGDALIVFSRKQALIQKEHYESLGFKVSIIYGMLSPEVRKEQAKLFLDGETDIVISTDAIGMGLNLPIKRVIFTTIMKYFNKEEHIISLSEIKQIAGRAGRFNLYPEGFVGIIDQAYSNKWNFQEDVTADTIKEENRFMLKRINEALNANLSYSHQAILGPDFEVFSILNEKLEKNNYEEMHILEFLYFFNKISVDTIFKKANIKEHIKQTELINYKTKSISNIDEDLWKFSIAPVMLNNEEHTEEFERLFLNYFNNLNSDFIECFFNQNLEHMEVLLKSIELYQWLSNQFDNHFDHCPEELSKTKELLTNNINNILIGAI